MAYDNITQVTDDIDDNLAAYQNEKKVAIDKLMSAAAYASYVRTQSMTANVTLTNSDFPIQSFSPTAARDLTMPTVASTNHVFYVANRSATYDITVKNSGGTTIGTVAAEKTAVIISDGANGWYLIGGEADVTAGGGDKYPCEARLTLETGVAISSTDQDAKATVYLTKFQGDQIAVYDGSSAWTTLTLGSDLSITLSTLSASLPHDIFIYNNTGSLAIEGLAWTNTTTRATALTTQNGVLVKSGATTRRYLGTIYLNSSKQCYDAKLHRWVWNYYNRADRLLYKDVDTAHTYTSVTYRYYNNDSTQLVDAVIGVAEDIISFSIGGQWSAITTGTDTGYAAIGVDGTTTRLSPLASSSINGRDVVPVFSSAHGVGYHTFTILEAASNSVDFSNYTLSGVIKA